MLPISFSIIICSHNPQPAILSKLLTVILNFSSASPQHEIILVDNNSAPKLSTNETVQQFLGVKKNARLLVETTPGLTAARLAGIRASTYDWIIFFDDDNEPSVQYLSAATELILQHPQTGAWGPGKINVCYINQKETAFLQKVKWLFQYRNYNETFIDNNTIEGSEYYPYGTGMVIRKDILIKYIEQVKSGQFTMSDRKGKNLSSAGDIQILFTCIQYGYYAGTSGSLLLNHNIDEAKANTSYVNRLVYALNSSQLKAYNEVFPERKQAIDPISNLDVVQVFINALRASRLNSSRFTVTMFISKKLGELNARIVAADLQKPLLLKIYENYFL